MTMEGASAGEIGIWARNYLRFDWTQTRGMPVLTVGQRSTAPIVLHPDHPPLIPAFILNRMLHTLALLTACGLWLVIFGFRFRHQQAGATVARLLIAWGVTCVVIGNTAAYTHESIWIFLTPGIAVSTALLIEWLFLVTEQYLVAPVMGLGVALIMAMFATWTGSTTFRRLYPTTPAAPFTPMEMGQAIQAAAPDPGDLALVIGGDGGPGAQLWFYGDRALRVNIWSITEVEERLTEDWADLVYNFDVQAWNATAAGIVFPLGRRFRRRARLPRRTISSGETPSCLVGQVRSLHGAASIASLGEAAEQLTGGSGYEGTRPESSRSIQGAARRGYEEGRHAVGVTRRVRSAWFGA